MAAALLSTLSELASTDTISLLDLSPTTKCVNSCLEAFNSGYRLLDTAQYYENEEAVGKAVHKMGVSRGEVFLTSKILNPGTDILTTYGSIEASVLKLDPAEKYADLFLIHSPNGGAESRKMMWNALEQAKSDKLVRNIGVSNYGIKHIEEMKEYSDPENWPPVVNQLEIHPWCQQKEIVEYCRKNDIIVMAYCPLVRNYKAGDETLMKIAEKNGCATSQVLVRWSIQKGFVPLPKSDTPARIKMNVNVFGDNFGLDEEDMKLLDGLDRGSAGSIVQAVSNE